VTTARALQYASSRLVTNSRFTSRHVIYVAHAQTDSDCCW